MANQTVEVVLTGVNTINKFVTVMNSFSGTAMLVSDQQRINAKSFVGVLNMEKNVPVKLCLDGDKIEIQRLLETLELCIV